MKIYLVGGAVRDKLLGIPVKEKDWVVVGATVDDMLKQGFRQVGKDFPVFLHPDTHEEYALARTERKVGRGYTGFNFDTSPEVTLEEDLKRRDLTINAMAETQEGDLIDPYEGRRDLKDKFLRHVSAAFVEDPVRILRIARFASRFPEFNIAPETNTLMKQMVSSGEVDALVAERVWKELERALSESHPEKFFQVLNDCDALDKLFPQLGEKEIQALKAAAQLSKDVQVRFAAMFFNIPEDTVKQLCNRYRVPSHYRDLALLVSRYFERFCTIIQRNKLDDKTAEEIIDLLELTDAFRRQERFHKFLELCQAVVNSERKPSRDLEKIWKSYFNIANPIEIKSLIEKGFTGKQLAEQIKQERISQIITKAKDLPF